jgi:hypothetical protein
MAKKKKDRVTEGERQLLSDIKELTSKEFVYEDLWCGMVPFNGKLSELQTGPPVPFAELSWREQADVLRSFVPWDRYPERDWDNEYRISENIAAGKQPEQWLEGTSLRQGFVLLAEGKTPPQAKECPEMTAEEVEKLLGPLEAAWAGQSPKKAADGKVSLIDLRNESQKEAKGEERQKAKSHDIER